MTSIPEDAGRGPAEGTRGEPRPLHEVGRRVAQDLGIPQPELAALPPSPAVPPWPSRLRVAELAYDSVALASLMVSLLGRDRGTPTLPERSIHPDPARLRASFGSEKIFRFDGSAPSIWAAFSGFWQVRDGWVRTHGNYPHHAARLAQLVGLSPTADRSRIAEAFAGWSRLELESQAAEVGAIVAAVRSPSEWRQHPHARAIDETPVVHFEQTRESMPRAWVGASRLPLDGVRVLDLTRVIAGPVATRDLAVAGADVLRVDAPQLPEPPWQHLDTGHEKRTTLLDLDDPRDRQAFDDLLAKADVVVHGYRPSALARYGIDAPSLHERFPGVVVAQLSAWGTTGPWGDRRGFDSIVQAATGIAVIESDDGRTPGALPVQALDHSAGHFLAASIASALRRQRTQGGSWEIRINLARIAHELLAAGPAPSRERPDNPGPLPSVSVPVIGGPADDAGVVTCAPPILGLPQAPADYRSPLHFWGTDEPAWR